MLPVVRCRDNPFSFDDNDPIADSVEIGNLKLKRTKFDKKLWAGDLFVESRTAEGGERRVFLPVSMKKKGRKMNGSLLVAVETENEDCGLNFDEIGDPVGASLKLKKG